MLQEDPPSVLTEAEQLVWREVYPLIVGRAEQCDMFAVVNFCRDEALLRKCMAKVATEGETVDGGREGKRMHPALKEAGSIKRRQAEFFRSFGLTPRAREEFPDMTPPDTPIDEEEELQSATDDGF